MPAIASLYPKRVRGGFKAAVRYSSLEVPDTEALLSRMILFCALSALLVALLAAYFLGFAGIALALAFIAAFAVANLAFYSWLILSADSKASFVDAILPDALRLVSSNLRSGLTVDRALMQSAREEFGPLKDAIDLAGKRIATGTSEDKAFLGMLDRIRSENFSRAIDLMNQGIRSGGQLSGILDKIADVFRDRSLLDKEMRSSILMYAIFIFFVIGLAAPILFGISDYLLNNTMKGISSKIPEINMTGLAVTSPIPIPQHGGGVNPEFMTLYMVIALVISSISGSIVLGQILSGKEKAGLKFIPVLITMSIVLFFAIKYLLSLTLGAMMSV